MLPDGSGRQTLQPPMYGSGGAAAPMDVSSGVAPITVLFLTKASATDPFTLSATLIARDASGGLIHGSAVALLAPGSPEPLGGSAVFSPDGLHIAYLGGDLPGTVLYEGDVVRDAANHVVALESIREVVDLATLGSPSDSPTHTLVLGIDYAPDGSRLVASIHDDLWIVQLGADRAYLSSQRLTRTTAFAELRPRWSPAGDVVAYYGSPFMYIKGAGYYGYSTDSNIFTRELATRAVRQLSSMKGKGARDPTWSPSGDVVMFAATGPTGVPRSAPCGSSVNSDLFTVRADGSGKPVDITNTVGTSVEGIPLWGW